MCSHILMFLSKCERRKFIFMLPEFELDKAKENKADKNLYWPFSLFSSRLQECSISSWKVLNYLIMEFKTVFP